MSGVDSRVELASSQGPGVWLHAGPVHFPCAQHVQVWQKGELFVRTVVHEARQSIYTSSNYSSEHVRTTD